MLQNVQTEFEALDVAITGKMVKVYATLDESIIQMKHHLPAKDKDYIREQLAIQLAQFMMQNNLIEFTQMKDPIGFQIKIMGRAFVTPNGETKIIRTLKR